MKSQALYHFYWNDLKALANLRKHGIAFQSAVTVFDDPLAVTRYDGGHSEIEERWSTVGQMKGVVHVAVFHTLGPDEHDDVLVKVISARKATNEERREYESGEYRVREVVPFWGRRTMKDDEEMPAQIDFSQGERGKFYRKDAVFHYPVFLAPDLLKYFSDQAHREGVNLEPLLNKVLQGEMERTQNAG
jgi:uncharacterized DUF497 family protein